MNKEERERERERDIYKNGGVNSWKGTMTVLICAGRPTIAALSSRWTNLIRGATKVFFFDSGGYNRGGAPALPQPPAHSYVAPHPSVSLFVFLPEL